MAAALPRIISTSDNVDNGKHAPQRERPRNSANECHDVCAVIACSCDCLRAAPGGVRLDF